MPALRRFRPRTPWRRAWTALLAAAIAVCALGASGASVASAAPPPQRGVTVHSLSNEQVGDMDRTLDSAKALGANVVRVDVWWSVLEQEGKGKYTRWYLERFDRFVNAAHARGMKVLPVLLWTPCWASGAPDPIRLGCLSEAQHYGPASASAYGDIARFVASRYGSRLAGLEVWNEPNHPGFLSGSDPATAYVKIVKAANAAVNAVNPRLPVVAGGLSGADRSFLEALYRRGMRGHYDVLSIHPYNGANAPDAKLGNPGWEFLGGIKHIRAAQNAVGDKAPLWLGEFGWNTSLVRDGEPVLIGLDEQTQADYLARAFKLLADPAQGLGYVKGAIVYELRNLGTSRLIQNDNYGLVRHDFSRKPAYGSVKSAFRPGSAAASKRTTRGPASTTRHAKPRLRLKLRYKRARTNSGRRCASRVRASVTGDDRRKVRRVLFGVRRGKRTRGKRLDKRAPFARLVHRKRRARSAKQGYLRSRSYQARARVRMKDGRIRTVTKRFRGCA